MLPNAVTDNPALVVGALRALLLLVAAFWPGLFTTQQQEAIVALVVASLAFTAVTVRTTVPKTPSEDASSRSIQVPPPA